MAGKPNTNADAVNADLAAFLAEFDVTTTPRETVKPVTPYLIPLAEKLYNDSAEMTFSFRGGKKWNNLEGEAAATAFELEWKNVGPQMEPQRTTKATRDGITVKAYTINKIGRKGSDKGSNGESNGAENGAGTAE